MIMDRSICVDVFAAQASHSHEANDNNVDALAIQSDVTTHGVPDPATQRDIIARIDTECTCTYAVHKQWYRKWEDYVTSAHSTSVVATNADGTSPRSEVEAPGAVEMDITNDSNNEYINEDAWKCFARWFGIAASHQLDRKHLYFKDEKMFDVCMLSPFSGIVEHSLKKFNRFEEIGYIECQLRRIFRVSDHRRTRLWISEKAQVPRFRQLLSRFRMLNDCIHRDKVYILALEEALPNDAWPTGEPGEPKGELSKYSEIVIGLKADDQWSLEIEESLDTLSTSVADSIGHMAEAFLQNGRQIIQEREQVLEKTRKHLQARLEEVRRKEQELDEKRRDVIAEETRVAGARKQLDAERRDFDETRERFQTEIATLEKIHRIQETKIKLDIGGQIHTTSIQTLRRDPDSMLAAMFSGRHELSQEQDGSYFIDRDGTFFRYILNFLRDGTLDSGTLPNNVPALREILREAKYYQLQEMVKYLEEMIGRATSPQHTP